MSLNNSDEAFKYFKNSIKLNEDFPYAYNNLGIAYLATKDNEKSKSMFEEALKIDPTYKPALDNLENLEKID